MVEAVIIGLFVLAIIIIVAIVTSLFWFWMLIDCLKRKKYDDKLVWILVLLFLGFAGAILYYYIEREKPKKR
jgi:hypothetical protein